MKRRVTFFLPSFRHGGAEFVTRVWCEQLHKFGWAPRAVLLAYQPKEPDIGCPVKRATPTGSSRLQQMAAIDRLLRSDTEQIAVSVMTRTNLQLLATALRIRRPRPHLVVTEHSVPYAEPNDSPLHSVGRRFATGLLYKRADAVVAVSHASAAALTSLARFAPGHLYVIPNPALGKVGAALPRPTRRTETLSIVVPGRLVEKKRPLLALDIAERLLPKFGTIRVIYFGEGPLLASVGNQRRSVEVSCLGWVENWFDHVPKDGIVLLPSAAEGCGNVLVEAAARGVASVGSSSALRVADAIIPGGTGTLALTDSVEAYASAVLEASRLRVEVPGTWLDRFSATNSSAAFSQVLSGVVQALPSVGQSLQPGSTP